MTKIKTAKAWGILSADTTNELWESAYPYAGRNEPKRNGVSIVPVVIVHGLTEAEVHEAAAVLSACRDLGIETVGQLRSKVQPDPRVAVLDAIARDLLADSMATCKHCRVSFECHGCCCLPHNILQNRLIAAQRGEVEK